MHRGSEKYANVYAQRFIDSYNKIVSHNMKET